MHIINVTVRNKIAVNPAQDRYVCGNSDFVVRFDFDEEWDEFDVKTARFVYSGGYQEQVFMGNECPVPVISNVCVFEVGVFAGNLSTSTPASVPALKSILCGGGTLTIPEDDTYHHVMEEMAKVAHSARSDAEASAQSAEAAVAAAKEVVQSAESAKQHSENADVQAKAAAEHTKAAKQSETNAIANAEAAKQAKDTAIANANNAEAYAKDARADAESAGASATEAAASAQSAAASSQAAGESAQASAQSAALAAQIVKEMTGGTGGESGSKEVTILTETTLVEQDADAGVYVLLTPFATKPAGGMLCTVAYNGTAYQCVSAKFEAPDGNAVALGNFALLGAEGGNADAPFVMVCAPDGTEGMYAMMMVTDAPASVTVGITAKVVDEAIKAYVDNKVGDALSAIPEPTTDVLTVTADMQNLNVTSASHTYAEIVEAIKAGKAVQMVVSQGEIGQTIVAPLITWNESGNNRMLMFQAMALAEEGAAVTITFNGNTGSINAEFRELDIAPPEKGVDYWTDADKAEIIADVIAALDAAEGVSF